VLKFGGSSLKCAEDVSRIAAYVQDLCADGSKCAVVVSAFHGETDRLLAEANALAATPCPSILPRHLLVGEEHSASALALALIGMGVRATSLAVAELQLYATGDPLAASPLALHGPLAEQLDGFDAVVAPGFGGWCRERKRAVLLGRGGSDLTAIHVARALGLQEATLIKDVNGIYSKDPNSNPDARWLSHTSWAEARAIAGQLIQRSAIDAAEAFGISILIRSMDRPDGSIIGPIPDVIALPAECTA
jgi:homoserine dehydrogenase